MAVEWVEKNLNVIKSPATDGKAISWGDNVYTEVTSFIRMYGEVIEEAIESGHSVEQAIIDNDNGRGFAKYFQ